MRNQPVRPVCLTVVGLLFLFSAGHGALTAQRASASAVVDRIAAAKARILEIEFELGGSARQTSFDQSPGLRDGVMTLLRERAAALTLVMREAPDAATALALSPSIRTNLAALGADVQRLIETAGEWSGRLEALAEDDFETGAGRTLRYLTGADPAVEVHFAGDAPRVSAGQSVSVTGLRLGNVMAVSQWREQDAIQADAASCPTTGDQKVAVILVSFATKPLRGGVTPAMMNEAYFGTSTSLNTFLRESSYGRAWATGQVLGSVVLDADYLNQPFGVRDAALRAAASLADLRTFSRFALVVPQAALGMTSGGLGTVGCSTMPLATGTVFGSTVWLGDVSLGSHQERVYVAAHEMGHNLGLDHARAADFGDEPLGPVGALPVPFDQLHDYGDPFSNMGAGALAHWAAPQKAFLGWLQAGTEAVTLEASGRYTLRPYEETASGVKAIRVRRGTGNNTWLWIENRQAVGTYDAALPSAALTGALVHYEDSSWIDTGAPSNLVRFNADAGGQLFGNAPLASGTSWADPYSNLALSVTRGTSGTLNVDVSYAAAPTCPTSLTPSSLSMDAIGGSATLDVLAPSGCAWTAAGSASWTTISSGATGTGNGRVGVSVAASTTSADRWARIVVGGTSVAVIQKGLAGSATLAPEAASFPATGGTGTIAVSTTTSDYAWSFSSNATWIQSVYTASFSSIGSTDLRYIVSENTSTSARTGTITIAGRTFTVSQAAGGPNVSQLAWRDLAVQAAPSSRLFFGSASFGTSGQIVVYAGNFNTTQFSDTWVWSGTGWAQAAPVHSPGTRSGFVMAYDEARGRIVGFGGSTAAGDLNDTWLWNGSDWTQAHPVHSPPARWGHAMAYHAASGKTVLFGGNGAYGYLGDTWEWDGVDWTERSGAVGPAPRGSAAIAYDAARQELILFGGARENAPAVWFADTWVWNGEEWAQKSVSASPSPREGARMAYHPGLGEVVLVGGYGTKPGYAPGTTSFDYRFETWLWNGEEWTQAFPNLSPDFSWTYALTYDASRGVMIAHLGDDLICADRGPKDYALSLGPGAVVLSRYGVDSPAAASQGTIGVTALVGWTAVSADSWLTVTAGSAGSGNGTIAYQAAPNTSSQARRGTIRVGNQLISVRQVGYVFQGPGNGGPATGTVSGTTLTYNGASYSIVDGKVTFPDCSMYIVIGNGLLIQAGTAANCTAGSTSAGGSSSGSSGGSSSSSSSGGSTSSSGSGSSGGSSSSSSSGGSTSSSSSGGSTSSSSSGGSTSSSSSGGSTSSSSSGGSTSSSSGSGSGSSSSSSSSSGGSPAFAGPGSGGPGTGAVSGTTLTYNGASYSIVDGKVTFPDCSMYIALGNGMLLSAGQAPGCTPAGGSGSSGSSSGGGSTSTSSGGSSSSSSSSSSGGSTSSSSGGTSGGASSSSGGATFAGPRTGGPGTGAVSGTTLTYNGSTFTIVDGKVTFPDCSWYIALGNGMLLSAGQAPGCTPAGGSGSSGSSSGGSSSSSSSSSSGGSTSSSSGGSGSSSSGGGSTSSSSGSGGSTSSSSGGGSSSGGATFAGPRTGGPGTGAVSGTTLTYNGSTFTIVDGKVTFPDCSMYIALGNGMLLSAGQAPGCTPAGGSSSSGSSSGGTSSGGTSSSGGSTSSSSGGSSSGSGSSSSGGSSSGGTSSGGSASSGAAPSFAGPGTGGPPTGVLNGTTLTYNGTTYAVVNGKVMFPDCSTAIVLNSGFLIPAGPASGCVPGGG